MKTSALSKLPIKTKLLILALFIGGLHLAAIGIWHHYTHRLTQSIDNLSNSDENIDMLERGIASLYKADNNFNLYIVTLQNDYLKAYTQDINYLSAIADSLNASYNNQINSQNIAASITAKKQVGDVVIRLKKATDSLLVLAKVMDTNKLRSVSIPEFDIKKIQRLTKQASSTDSIVSHNTGAPAKKTFLKKFKELFKSNADSLPQSKTIVKRNESVVDSINEQTVKKSPEKVLLNEIHSFYLNKIHDYTFGRTKLNATQKQLAAINASLINEMDGQLQKVKKTQLQQSSILKAKAYESSEEFAHSLSLLALVALVVSAIALFLVIKYLKQLHTTNLHLEAEKKKAIDLAKQKSSILSSMSHELRSPLTAISGFVEEYPNASPEQKPQYLNAISNSANVILGTVNQILDFAKLDSGQTTLVNYNFNPYLEIEKAISTLSLKAKQKGLQIQTYIPNQSNISVYGDGLRLQQVVINLVDNAVKYTKQGAINITAQLYPFEEGYKLHFEVADTGIGIPKDKQEAVFKEFERLEDDDDRRFETGTGLGLSITKLIIEQQKGHIYIKESTPNGSTFIVEIPYSKEIEEETKEQAHSNANGGEKTIENAQKQYNILFVDDDAFNALLIKALIKGNPYTFTHAENGKEALDLLKHNTYDLILTDINMSVMNGIEFAKRARKESNYYKTPIIAVTANVMTEDVKYILNSGINDVILKPFTKKDLMAKIEQYLS